MDCHRLFLPWRSGGSGDSGRAVSPLPAVEPLVGGRRAFSREALSLCLRSVEPLVDGRRAFVLGL